MHVCTHKTFIKSFRFMHIECGTVDCGREYTYSAISVGGPKSK